MFILETVAKYHQITSVVILSLLLGCGVSPGRSLRAPTLLPNPSRSEKHAELVPSIALLAPVDKGTNFNSATDAKGDRGFGPSGALSPAPNWSLAELTHFTSYPDPQSAECLEYNGCEWAGMFAAIDGRMSEEWVQAHNIIAVHAKHFQKYKLKTLRIRRGDRQIDAKVYDYCSDSDCDGCCTRNSDETGFLIDLESYGWERSGLDDGVVQWHCLDCEESSFNP